MDLAAAKARLSAKKQQSQSLKVQPSVKIAPVMPPARFSSPAPIVCPPSPPASTLPNKKLRFSDVASVHEEEDGTVSARVSLDADETEDGSAGCEPLKRADSCNGSVNAALETTGSMTVLLRVRPLNEAERKAAAPPVLIVEPPSTVKVVAPESSQAFKNGEKHGSFTFSHVYDESVSQGDLYTHCMAAPTRSAVMDGSHAHVFAYGMTNAGKTFTITGNDDNPGILPRTLAAIFKHIDSVAAPSTDQRKLPASTTPSSFVVSVSYLEIYNEQCFDLLGASNAGQSAAAASASFNAHRPAAEKGAPTNRNPLQIKDGRDGIAYVRSLRHVTVKTAQAALEIMKEGANNKRVAETHMNADSSRSHTVFTVSLFLKQGGEADDAVSDKVDSSEIVNSTTGTVNPSYKLWSRINIVDLAGSERQSRTNSQGARLKEAGAINNSLMQLMKCFEAMRHNTMHPESKKLVPYRDTKLTRLFADSFGGLTTGATVMIVNAGPAAADFDETLHALKYGALVKDVRITKDRIVTRWDPGQYGADGRRLLSKAEAEAELEAAAAKLAAKKSSKAAMMSTTITANAKRVIPPLAQASKEGAGGLVSARSAKESLSSTVSGSSAISMSMINAVLHGDAHAKPPHGNGGHKMVVDDEFEQLPHDMEPILDLSYAVPAVPEAISGEEFEAALQAAIAQREAAWLQEKADLVEGLELLSREVETMAEQLEDAQDSAAGVEDQVREEVAIEMADRLAQVEAECKQKLAAQASKYEEKIAKLTKLHSLKEEANANTRHSTASSASADEAEEKIEELTAQVNECEAEIDRLNAKNEQLAAKYEGLLTDTRFNLEKEQRLTKDLRTRLQAAEAQLEDANNELRIASNARESSIGVSASPTASKELQAALSRIEDLTAELEAATTEAGKAQAALTRIEDLMADLEAAKEQTTQLQAANEQLRSNLQCSNGMINDLRLSVSDALTFAEQKQEECLSLQAELDDAHASIHAQQTHTQRTHQKPASPLVQSPENLTAFIAEQLAKSSRGTEATNSVPPAFAALTSRVNLTQAGVEHPSHLQMPSNKRSRSIAHVDASLQPSNARKRSRGNSVVQDGPAPTTRVAPSKATQEVSSNENAVEHPVMESPVPLKGPAKGRAAVAKKPAAAASLLAMSPQAATPASPARFVTGGAHAAMGMRSPLGASGVDNKPKADGTRKGRVGPGAAPSKTKAAGTVAAGSSSTNQSLAATVSGLPSRTPIVQRLRSRPAR